MRNVIMMHSVGSNNTNWKERWLSVDKVHFETFCRYLNQKKYKTYFLDHWYNQEDKANQYDKTLYLTFDDGYLDILLIAYPILKKYGIKATVFVNPEFVDPSSGVRTLSTNNGNTLGFLNWDEIKFLDKSGYVDIQSHTMTHNYYFKSNKIIDVHVPLNDYHWLAWISNPTRKYAWQLENQSSYTPYGYPIFEYGRALSLRRYIPDPKLIDKLVELYKAGKSIDYIMQACTELQKDLPGRYETDDEMVDRFRYEICQSKSLLEDKLGKKVDFLCWPGGGYCDLALDLAKEAGYKASTISSKDSIGFSNRTVVFKRIVRLGMDSTIFKGRYLRAKRVLPVKFKYHLVWNLMVEEKRPLVYFLAKVNNFILRFL